MNIQIYVKELLQNMGIAAEQVEEIIEMAEETDEQS